MNVGTRILNDGITSRLLGWLLAERDPEAWCDETTGRYVLPYPPTYRRIVVWFALLAITSLAGSLLSVGNDPRAILLCTAVFGTLVIRALWMLYETCCVRVSADDVGLYRLGVFHHEIVLPWAAITQAGYSTVDGTFRFRSEKHPTITVSVYRNGLASLARSIRYAPRNAAARSAARLVEARADCPF